MVRRLVLTAIVLATNFACAQTAPMRPAGQTISPLPDAPSAVAQQKKEKKRELLADDPYRRLSTDEKLHEWLHGIYAPSTFFAAGIDTAYASLTGDMRYCCGGDAMGKQYVASVADAETRYFFGKFLFPTLMGQD